MYEPEECFIKRAEEVLKHTVYNPKKITAEELNKLSAALFNEQAKVLRPNNMEIMGQKLEALLYESLGLKFDVSMEELEYERWVATEPIFPMDGIVELLTYLNKQGIRTGVVSNLAHSGKVLSRRIDDTLPVNQFEFIVASSEYLYRKPNRYIFDVAINKAELDPQNIWYCGDNIVLDIEGSASAGMFPVWYESKKKCIYRKPEDRTPQGEHLHIHEWCELVAVLENR